MKKIFNSLFISAALTVGLTSCLGSDNGSSYTEGDAFGVVRVVDNHKVAALSSGYIISGGQIDSYSVGDAFIVSYKVDFNNWLTNNILKADYATISEKNVYLNADQKVVKGLKENVTVAAPNTNNVFLTITTPMGSGYDFLENRWLISFSAKVKSDQNISFDLYYDKDNQKPDTGILPENAIILDAVLIKSVSDLATQELVTKSASLVVNLTSLRAENIKKMENASQVSDKNTTVVWLRYPKLKANNEPGNEYIKDAFKIFYYKQSTTN